MDIDVLIMTAVIGAISLSIWTLIQVRITRSELHQMATGIGGGFQQIIPSIEEIKGIPEVLRSLDLGGVQLMPQKSLGEMVLDHVMRRFQGESQNSGVESTPSVIDQPSSESDHGSTAQGETPNT